MIAAKITAFKEFIAIELLATASIPNKLTLSVDHPHCIGQIIHGLKDQLAVSKEALELLSKVGRSHDDIGEIDCFKSNDGKLNFGWMGGGKKLVKITAKNYLGSSSYVPPKEKDVTIIPNEFPEEAKAHIKE